MKESLPIIVTGKGLIPRIGGLGPRLQPFTVDIKALEVIVRAPASLGVTFVDPVDGTRIPLNHTNYKKIFTEFNARPKDTNENKVDSVLVIDPPPVNNPIQTHDDPPPIVDPIPSIPAPSEDDTKVTEDKKEEENSEEKKPEASSFKPPEKKDNRSFSMPRFTKPMNDDQKTESENSSDSTAPAAQDE